MAGKIRKPAMASRVLGRGGGSTPAEGKCVIVPCLGLKTMPVVPFWVRQNHGGCAAISWAHIKSAPDFGGSSPVLWGPRVWGFDVVRLW